MPSTLDEAFRALANAERRWLLLALQDRGEGSEEPLRLPEDLPARETDRVEMYHAHLPLLEEAGFVAWDRDADRVSRGPQFEELRPFLRALRGPADRLLAHE